MSILSKLKVWIGVDTSGVEKGMKKTGGMLQSFKGKMIAAFSVGALVSFGKEAAALAKVQADAEKKLSSVLRATGNSAGFTAEQLKEYASQLQGVTRYGDEATLEMMSMLAAFKSVRGDVFKEAVASAQDLATVMGTSLNEAAKKLGKALEAPLTGLSELRESGIVFTEEQIRLVQRLVGEGKKEEAQWVILQRVHESYGDAAKVAAGNAYDAQVQLGNAWGDLKEAVGDALTPGADFINALTKEIEEQTAILNDESIPAWRKWLGWLVITPPGFNKGLAKQNAARKEANRQTIEALKLGELEASSLRALAGEYRDMNRTQDNYYQDTYAAIMEELRLREAGKAAETAAQKARRLAAEEIASAEEKHRQELAEIAGMEERNLSAIGRKMDAIRKMRAETDVADVSSLSYYTNEIIRLEALKKKIEEVGRVRTPVLRTETPVMEVLPGYGGGLQEAVADIRANTAIEDLSLLPEELDKVKPVVAEAEALFADLSDTIKQGMADLAVGFGESIGAMIAGGAGLNDLAAMAGNALGSVVSNIGKATIAAGVGAMHIKASLSLKNPVAAIAAGVALVALGSTIKNMLGNISNGGSVGGMGGVNTGNEVNIGGTRDLTYGMNEGKIQVEVSGELRAKGSSLVAAISNEDRRKRVTT